jgi:hypothetical protein
LDLSLGPCANFFREETVRASLLKMSSLWGVLALLPATPVWAQGPGEPIVSGSSVGYIDSAPVQNLFRLRVDAAYDNRRPTRAEFFWPKGRPNGPGLPLPETNVDYQEITAYLELTANSWLSGFVECPVRFLNPDINRNTAGYADMNAGFKAALVQTEDTVATFQFRTYLPTGDAERGLGNNHVSLEPAFLLNQKLTDPWTLEGELRYWVPIGGTDFAGDIVRYGLGLSYGTRKPDAFWMIPVVELVGWTVLGGKEARASSLLSTGVKDAAGDTIVNAKIGMRLGINDRSDIYAGYGRALTGDTWYKNTLRLEFRLQF